MATMSGKRDYYEVLGVAREASEKEIKDAYRKLAIKNHPDKNPGDNEAIARFKEAAEAFEVLGDAEKRARFDRFGHAGVGGSGAQFHDANDVFQAFGDLFGDGLFGEFFGGGRGRGRRVSKGADIRCDAKITLLEAARGVTRTVQFQRHERCGECQGSGAKKGTKPETCKYCGGHGQVVQSSGIFRVQTNCPACQGQGSVVKEHCTACKGRGHVARRVQREVEFPAGVDGQTKLRISGEGEPSPNGGPAGDVYCFIHVEEHPLFVRDGQNLICQVPVTYTQAALGATIDVPTLDGRETLDIPSGTQPGDVFTMRGRGMPDPRRRGVGDLLVQVHLDVPKRLEPREEQLLRELAELENANVSSHRKSFFEKLREYFIPEDENVKQKD